MYDNFKIANYNNSLVSPEFYAKPLSRLFSGDVIDGLTVVPGTGLQVTLQPGNAFLRYGSAAVASARIVSLVANFNLAIPTPDASNPRIDLVVIYVDNAVTLPVVDAANPPTSANLDGPGVVKAKIVSGTPASTPVAPTDTAIQSSVGAGNSYTVLAKVLVDKAPVSLIATGKITDARKVATVARGGWFEVGRTTLTSSSNTISVASLSAYRYLKIMIAVFGTGGTIEVNVRLNNDSSNSYSQRISTNGGVDTALTSRSNIQVSGPATYGSLYLTLDGLNISSVEKNLSGTRVANFSSAGAATAPDRGEVMAKWSNTSSLIDRVDILNIGGSGTFAAGSELVVLGRN